MTKNHWDQSFSNSEYIYGKEPNIFIQKMSDIIPTNAHIACLAEGEGRNAVYLAEQGHEVVAYDQSQVGLKKAQKLAEQRGVQIQTNLMDLTKEHLPEGHFDASILVFGHVSKNDQTFLFENMFKSVKSGGLIIFEVYSKRQIEYKTGGPGNVEALYDAGQLLKVAEQYEVLHFYYGEAERFEGINHTGLCHIIQVAVRKI